MSLAVLNMNRCLDRDSTAFCNSEPDLDRRRFRKNSTGADMDIQSALFNADKCF